MSTLKMARELAQFEDRLDWLRSMSRYDHGNLDGALAASCKVLIRGLVELDEQLGAAILGDGFPSVPDVLARAMAAFREEEAQAEQDWARDREADEARYTEAVRRHEVAITVKCPYCDAEPGTPCRTAGPTAVGHPKGTNDHKARYQAATTRE
jgi:hypothetical protein